MRRNQCNPDMTLATRRGPLSCKCRAGCPPYTWPFNQYFITLTLVDGTPTGYTGRLMRAPGVNCPIFFCCWDAAVPLLPFITERILMQEISSPPPGQVGYRFIFERILPLSPPEQWTLDSFWTPPSPIPIDPNSAISCSRVTFTAPRTSGIGPPLCVFEAAYPDACDHNDYPAKTQSPWHHDTPRGQDWEG